MSGLREVTADIPTGTVLEWRAEIGDPRDFPPVMLFVASDIALALRQGKTTWPNRNTLAVTQSGYATVTDNVRAYVYELFPVRFSGDRPYDPPCYVGRWPD